MRLRFGGGLHLTGMRTVCLTIVLSLSVTNGVFAADEERSLSGDAEQTRPEASQTKDDPVGDSLFGSGDADEAGARDDARAEPADEPRIPDDPLHTGRTEAQEETSQVSS